MNRLLLLLCVLGGGGLVFFAGWRYRHYEPAPTRQYALLLDTSKSSQQWCGCVIAKTRQLLQTTSANAPATLSVFALGDDRTANEPVLVQSYALPIQRKVIEGTAPQRQRQADILLDLERRCAQLAPTERSPLYFNVARVLTQLQSNGCRAGADCQLLFFSDGEEKSEPRIKAALASGGNLTPQSLPEPLAHDGIHLTWTGFAQTKGIQADAQQSPQRLTKDRDAAQAKRLEAVWRQILGENLLHLEPFCAPPVALNH